MSFASLSFFGNYGVRVVVKVVGWGFTVQTSHLVHIAGTLPIETHVEEIGRAHV